MALITNSTYQPPFWLANHHIETIYPALFRKVSFDAASDHVIITTPDNDFFELSYYHNHSDKTVIISHGLEGNKDRHYMLGMAKIFYQQEYNVVTWSYRGCDGQVNNSIKSYHSGFTEDLEEVIKYADKPNINSLALVGFSLGGNLTLRYLGKSGKVNKKVGCAVALSVPLDLHHGCLKISEPSNLIYTRRFLKTLKKKVKQKAKQFPSINTNHLSKIRNLMTFDDYYTAPLHGFKDALDYYNSCSSIYVLDKIKVPTLIINALNDPFLPKECYPYDLLKDHPFVHLETPSRGGHVGFHGRGGGVYWSESRSLEFIESSI